MIKTKEFQRVKKEVYISDDVLSFDYLEFVANEIKEIAKQGEYTIAELVRAFINGIEDNKKNEVKNRLFEILNLKMNLEKIETDLMKFRVLVYRGNVLLVFSKIQDGKFKRMED